MMQAAVSISSILAILLVLTANCKKHDEAFDEFSCDLPKDLVEEIVSYEKDVRDIVDFVLKGPFKGKTYDDLAKFIDKFGSRISGSEALEKSIDYLVNEAVRVGIRDVLTEDVMVPYWQRGYENATLMEPYKRTLEIIGLGNSISTDLSGITAEAIIVHSFEELEALSNDKVRDKIVIYNQPYKGYGATVKYRTNGAVAAAKRGAVAVLIRSLTPFSMNIPHTGAQHYKKGVKKIPVAAITTEGVDFLERLTRRGKQIKICLTLISDFSWELSRNLIIDIPGRVYPEELVIVSGHVDSWDVGEGAMDDGGGMMIAFEVQKVLRKLKKNPKRTIRTALWTAEELNLFGASAYVTSHKKELENIILLLESDEGTFRPTGLAMVSSYNSRCLMKEVLKLFRSVNITIMTTPSNAGSDMTLFIEQGVPAASLLNENDKYFWFHHTKADTMAVVDSTELDLCTAFWAAISYVTASLSVNIRYF